MDIKRAFSLALSLIVTLSGTVVLGVVMAASANAAVCGFQGLNSGGFGAGRGGNYAEALYTNCTKKNQKVRITYYYASRSQCFSPGQTKIYANPDLGALRGAKVIGSC